MRPFHPDILARLNLEAETIETVMGQRIDAAHRDLSNQAANWQPAPMPADWGITNPRRTS